MNNWETYDNHRFVAFLDIMGFKDFIIKNKSEVVYYKIMKKIRNILDDIDEFYGDDSDKNFGQSPNFFLKSVFFSDSILITSINDTLDAAINLLLVCNRFMAYCMKESIPIKGAVAHGKFYFNDKESIYFGQPLIDAYLLEEDLKLYGIVLHHTFESKMFSFSKEHIFYKNLEHFIIKYKTPLQNKNIYHYNLNWVDRAISDNSLNELFVVVKSEINSWLNKFYLSVSNQPRIYVDNTDDFIQFSLKKRFDKNRSRK